MSRQCGYTKPSGEGCRGTVRQGDTYCWAHDSKYQEARKKGQSRGGKNKPSRELLAINTRLKELAEQVIAKEIDRGDAAVAGQLYNYVLRGISVSLQAREQEELAREVEELRDLLDVRKDSRAWG